MLALLPVTLLCLYVTSSPDMFKSTWYLFSPQPFTEASVLSKTWNHHKSPCLDALSRIIFPFFLQELSLLLLKLTSLGVMLKSQRLIGARPLSILNWIQDGSSMSSRYIVIQVLVDEGRLLIFSKAI